MIRALAKTVVWLGVAVSLGAASQPLFAQPAAPATSDEERARIHYEKGTAAYGLEDFAEAARQYEAAFRLKLDPKLLFNAAQAHRRAGNRERAIALYENLLQLFPNAPNHQIARRHLADLQRSRKSSPPRPTSPAASSPAATAAAGLEPAPLPTPALPPPNPVLFERTTPPEPRPVWRRPWVWVAAGAVVAAGVITAVVLSTRGEAPARPPSWGTLPPAGILLAP